VIVDRRRYDAARRPFDPKLPPKSIGAKIFAEIEPEAFGRPGKLIIDM
jgi:hypothetical protein